jgi:site-specific recombinase XerD
MNSINSYLKSLDYSQTTITITEKTIYDFINWSEDQHIEAKHATYNEILGFMQHLQKRGLKQRTIQLHISNLGHYFKWLIMVGVREDNPLKGIKIQGVQRKRLYHIISMQDLEKVYEQIKGNEEYMSGNYQLWHEQSHHSQQMHRVMFGFMIWQGLGSSELKNLRVDDLKLREGKVYVAGDRRSNERTLKLESVQLLDLLEYLQKTRTYYQKNQTEQSDRVFITKRGGSDLNNRITALLKLINSINPLITQAQQLRASVITYWLKNNNLRQTQYMAGHRYVSSTEAYLVNDLDDLMEDIGKFHPLG